MIINNTIKGPANWSIKNNTAELNGIKGPESWGTVSTPAGPFDYTVMIGNQIVYHVNNPDACITYTGTEILVTYPGA